jgi:hypothetical protein
MLLRSPAEFYYKYLVVHPDRYTNDTIKQRLVDQGIDFISLEYLEGIRRRLRLPKPFYPEEECHQSSHEFICQEGVSLLFFPSKDMKLALKILAAPRAREFVETMLLSHAPHDAIAKAVSRYGVRCTPKAVADYSHFFWNVALLDSTQMKMLLQWRFDRVSQATEAGVDSPGALAAAAKRASYQDPRRLAADLPFSPFAAMLVQMRMGIMPTRVDIAARMTATRDLATMRALEVLHYGTPGDASRAFNYAMTAKIMNEMLESVQKPDEALREQLSAIALRTDELPVPSIHQLSGGRHTVDLQPTPQGTYELEPVRNPGNGE